MYKIMNSWHANSLVMKHKHNETGGHVLYLQTTCCLWSNLKCSPAKSILKNTGLKLNLGIFVKKNAILSWKCCIVLKFILLYSMVFYSVVFYNTIYSKF